MGGNCRGIRAPALGSSSQDPLDLQGASRGCPSHPFGEQKLRASHALVLFLWSLVAIQLQDCCRNHYTLEPTSMEPLLDLVLCTSTLSNSHRNQETSGTYGRA